LSDASAKTGALRQDCGRFVRGGPRIDLTVGAPAARHVIKVIFRWRSFELAAREPG